MARAYSYSIPLILTLSICVPTIYGVERTAAQKTRTLLESESNDGEFSNSFMTSDKDNSEQPLTPTRFGTTWPAIPDLLTSTDWDCTSLRHIRFLPNNKVVLAELLPISIIDASGRSKSAGGSVLSTGTWQHEYRNLTDEEKKPFKIPRNKNQSAHFVTIRLRIDFVEIPDELVNASLVEKKDLPMYNRLVDFSKRIGTQSTDLHIINEQLSRRTRLAFSVVNDGNWNDAETLKANGRFRFEALGGRSKIISIVQDVSDETP